jgi:hypothetical protein
LAQSCLREKPRPDLRADLAAFWLTITVTAGTNTKAETARFVREASAGMEALLGPLHQELRAGAGGRRSRLRV